MEIFNGFSGSFLRQTAPIYDGIRGRFCSPFNVSPFGEVSQQDAPSDNGAASATKLSTCLQEKQVREPSHRRKRKATNGRSGSGRDSKTLSPFDDGEELTPEDLVSIAEEYVKADKNAGLQELSTRECDFARQLSTAASPKADSESSLIAIDGNQKSPADETTSDSTRGPKDDKYFINTNRTGDPTQDMLDLFLGPLLKKTVEEKMSEFVPRTFSNELEKGSQNDVKEETLPLTKKRCTLRDKVAMLLD
ncbi:uncharacterized protein LOC120173414 [Hibiscus syriacus]|uniref:uncharacterized protein LOC120173414 n=1 Tax=Hibiscus syriacus TaxID=106335 RepID=UPI001920ACF6|nr:uncharacterized protein LOC120173414 [Hibiscus syriacus]